MYWSELHEEKEHSRAVVEQIVEILDVVSSLSSSVGHYAMAPSAVPARRRRTAGEGRERRRTEGETRRQTTTPADLQEVRHKSRSGTSPHSSTRVASSVAFSRLSTVLLTSTPAEVGRMKSRLAALKCSAVRAIGEAFFVDKYCK